MKTWNKRIKYYNLCTEENLCSINYKNKENIAE